MFGLNNFIDRQNNYFRGRLKKDRFIFEKDLKPLTTEGFWGENQKH